LPGCSTPPADFPFGYRYPALGFQDAARLDDGNLWPVSDALRKWSAAVKTKVAGLRFLLPPST
jgi:uncharacterized protein YdhG (YjbR/CyaY superfamily)